MCSRICPAEIVWVERFFEEIAVNVHFLLLAVGSLLTRRVPPRTPLLSLLPHLMWFIHSSELRLRFTYPHRSNPIGLSSQFSCSQRGADTSHLRQILWLSSVPQRGLEGWYLCKYQSYWLLLPQSLNTRHWLYPLSLTVVASVENTDWRCFPVFNCHCVLTTSRGYITKISVIPVCCE